ncbi:MAG: aspartate ammonia-lyase [Bacteroidetes bacterium]|nr:aspartate ammonia-lyase [Bacteroidota bacterium]
MKLDEKLSKGLTGIAGEYFVAAELSRRGFMASITLRNNDSIDIHASKLSNDKIFAIQVKSNQSGKAVWVLSEKSEIHHKENFFYVFVALRGENERPHYFIVPSKKVAEYVKEGHSNWLAKPGKKGQAHNDSSMRKFDDKNGEFLEKWDLLS